MGQQIQGLTRLPGWRERLAAVVATHRAHAFAWGVHDCGILAADAVHAITGIDPIEDYRGAYGSEVGLRRLLEDDGYSDAADFLVKNFAEIPASRATLGDLVLVDSAGIGAIGICNGRTIAAYGNDGVGFMPLGRALRAFRVG